MASSTRQPHYCQLCGSLAGDKMCCSSCKEAWYCSKEHQRADWKKSHKSICRQVKQHPQAIFVKVQAGEGNGLTNEMTNYLFKNKEQGLSFVSEKFSDHMSRPLRSQFSELLGWKLEVYCCTQCTRDYQILSSGVAKVFSQGAALNGAGIYLGCELKSGISRFNNLCGEIFVFGRRMQDGKSLVSDSLWGILNFIWDAMDLYGTDEDPGPSLVRWARRYREESWEPMGGSVGINVYCTNVHQSSNRVESIESVSKTDSTTRTQQQPQARNDFPDEFFNKCADEFVNALRSDMYPSEEAENMWGIEMSNNPMPDRMQDIPLGVLIYNVYQEIFKLRLFRGGETVYDSPGPASNKFKSDLAKALKFWILPRNFEEWTNDVVGDQEFPLKVYSTEMKRRGFTTDQNLVNPNLEGHRNFMKYFTGELRPS
jgi:hypothetical protein